MSNPQIEVVHNPKHASMPEHLRGGDYLVVAIQEGKVIALCAFERRGDAKSRAGWERRSNSRMGGVRYSAGYPVLGDDGVWACQ